MTLFLVSFVVMALAIIGLCAGVLLGRAPLTRGCGGDLALQVCPVCQPRRTPTVKRTEARS